MLSISVPLWTTFKQLSLYTKLSEHGQNAPRRRRRWRRQRLMPRSDYIMYIHTYMNINSINYWIVKP